MSVSTSPMPRMRDAMRPGWNGSIICRELLGLAGQTAGQQPSERTQEYYKKRPCPELCRMAAGILDDYIAAHPIEK